MRAHNLHEQFGPVVLCIRRGDGAGLRNHLAQYQAWLAKRELAVLFREKMDLMIWRTVCRKVCVLMIALGLEVMQPLKTYID